MSECVLHALSVIYCSFNNTFSNEAFSSVIQQFIEVLETHPQTQ